MIQVSIFNRSRVFQAAADFLFTILRYLRSLNLNSGSDVAIVTMHNLGDCVFTIPSIRLLLKHSAGKRVIIITYPNNFSIYKTTLRDVNYLLLNKEDFILGGRIIHPKYWFTFLKLPVASIFDLSGGLHSAGIVQFTGAKEKIGINLSLYRKIFTHFVPIRKGPHILDIYLDIIRQYYQEVVESELKQFENSITHIRQILIAPQGGWKAKEWGLQRFFNLGLSLQREFEVCFVFETGTIASDIREYIINSGISFVETETIDELIGLILKYDLFISNDTGPLYVANLMGKATFAIYGPTNPIFHVPFGNFHGYSYHPIDCSPFEQKFCDSLGGRTCFHHSCIAKLSIDLVEPEIWKFINDSNKRLELR